MSSNNRIEQTAAVVTVFFGSKIWGKAEQKHVPPRPSAGHIGSSFSPLYIKLKRPNDKKNINNYA